MKTKTIACFFLAFSFAFTTYAQNVSIVESNSTSSTTYSSYKVKKPKFWVGPKFGTDFIGIPSGSDDIKNGLKEQWQAGLLMQFGRTIYIQPECYYSVDNVLDASQEILSSTASIKVPALLGLRFLNLGLFSLHIMGGPEFVIPVKDDQNDLRKTTRHFVVGAGIDVLGFITADVRYLYDTSTQLNDHINSFDLQTTPLNLTVGLKLR